MNPTAKRMLGWSRDGLAAALLGRNVTVRPRGDGYRLEADVSSLDEVTDLAARLGPRRAA